MKGYGGVGKRLTSKETARLLGVSEASIKRWADGGLLPSEKTAGGHRRFRPEDVATFRRGKDAADANERAAATSAPATSPPRRVAARARFVGDAELLAEATFGALLDGSA
jgi:excisionase family DNA binding protein